ncbi:hypothetical protein MMC17_000606 [Xylographa soralifera]|nr:hypothetical protein [Xylographa soralifera]
MAQSAWQDIALQVQNYRDSTLDQIQRPIPNIPNDLPPDVTGMPSRLLSAREVGITDMVTEELVASLAAGKSTSTEVNCITEPLPGRALARAKELEEYFKEHGKPVGPLHGIPISVKEYIGMKGLDYNAGFVGWVGKQRIVML